MHFWSDNWLHWNELGEAEQYIKQFVRRWSWCYLSSKEKYGTIRYERVFTPIDYNWKWRTRIDWVLSIGGRYHNQYGPYPRFSWDNLWIRYKWLSLGRYVLRIAVKKACIKFPNVKDEILDDFEDGEYV